MAWLCKLLPLAQVDLMEFASISFLSFIMITSITPGPNNISSASMGMLLGYRKTLNYLLGISTGFFLLMLVCSLLSTSLLHYAPSAQQYLKYVGASYIIWLAWKTLSASYAADAAGQQLASYTRGLTLQVVNPKGLVYGLTIFTTFLAGTNGDYLVLISWVIFLALVCFACTSTWALFGALIQKYMRNQKIKFGINVMLSLALIYTALDIAGFLG
ncbi:LysE family transporter [Reichenbachiella sp.]|uniref:LysE family transporter n=1 Tax=Reichenbachiella sp. TaxID=2184521 RepID=UPI003297E33A